MPVPVSESDRYREAQIAAALKKIEDVASRVEVAVKQQLGYLTRDVASEKKRILDFLGAKGEPLVLIRTTVGARQGTFHYAARPCGKSVNLHDPKTALLHEAIAKRLNRCSACKRAYDQDARRQ